MPKAKTPRVPKAKAETKVLQMPEASGNGNGNYASRENLENEIRVRAYELYEQRGYTGGQADEDWLQAEREVLARHAHQQTA
jgi:hypothetical protein